MLRTCPYCRPGCGCGRELAPFSGLTDAIEVYNAAVSLHSLDCSILDVSSERVSRMLVWLGFLYQEPSPADLEAALDLLREVEDI